MTDEENMRHWIFDTDSTPQRFPLVRLIDRIEEVSGQHPDLYLLRKARGYGLQINEWDTLLEKQEHIAVPASELRSIGSGEDEWFYDMEAFSHETGILFGIHDSTAMFVEGPSDLVSKVAKTFGQTKKQPAH